ncbi:hypothetical protein HPB50_000182 [Hyalomma asiaticum]|uniref:Uncharacterized protein n=1 Tax=Hyalomma asiaticum TaxID=266040 RepID=A0ACB7TA28_HYAAI|nr:hypothetical protein HPB50_000182 [Hyalomma asiaticum]
MERILLFIVAVLLVHLRFSADTFSGFCTPTAESAAFPSGRLAQGIADSALGRPFETTFSSVAKNSGFTTWVYPPLTPAESSVQGIVHAHRSTLGPDRAPEMGYRYAGFTAYIPFSSTTELIFTASGVVRARGSVPSAAVVYLPLSSLGIKDAKDQDTGGVRPRFVAERA